MTDLSSLTAVNIAQQVSRRAVSAQEVAKAFLARIETLNPTINAICRLNPGAMEAAAQIDQRLARGETPRPLEGVPFLVKDNLETKGLRTTFGSRLMESYVPSESAICAERLAVARGVFLGKTNTPEFAHDVNTSNLLFGTTRNPWDPMVVSAAARARPSLPHSHPLPSARTSAARSASPPRSTISSASDPRRAGCRSIPRITPGTRRIPTLPGR